MSKNKLTFGPARDYPEPRASAFGGVVALIALAVLLYLGVRLAFGAPASVEGPDISLSIAALPAYAVLSTGRMALAYLISLAFTLVYGYQAARHRRAERILMPLLDVLQSVPILSFLPVVLLSFTAILPQDVAVELAAIMLIVTSQAWNLTFAWYQALTTIPKELREASRMFRFNGWLRLKTLELPFAALSLIWNSMMSWAGGWFFLMAVEIFTIDQRDFRLPGLGAYLREAADRSDMPALLAGIITLVLVIILLDQLIWRPLLAWADRFKVETVQGGSAPTSWFFDLLQSSRLLGWQQRRVWAPLGRWLDRILVRPAPGAQPAAPGKRRRWGSAGLGLIAAGALAFGAYQAAAMLLAVSGEQWAHIGISLGATLLRVAIALGIALAWTVPAGYLIGASPRLARVMQPIVQIAASVPATALFPALLLFMATLPGGLNLAAVILMLMGTQWYLLFNVIAGAAAIPQDLKHTARMLGLSRRERWRRLILPALFPYIVTGAITASGGAWNASIVAEYAQFNGVTHQVIGIGATITGATAAGEYPLLLAATLTMIVAVVLLNRLVWRRLYQLAEEKYRLE